MTSAQHMGWMLDEYEALCGAHRPGAVTGKPLTAGGSTGRAESTGFGLIYVLREVLKELSLPPDRTTASVQGFGMVARHAIELYQKIGGTVRAVSSWDQNAGEAVTYRRAEGIDLAELSSCADRFGGIHRDRAAEKGYDVLPAGAWLEQDVDILIPAALEHQIDRDAVDRISARVRVVMEGANGPTTEDAEVALTERGAIVVPDILANAGGVTCSYFEQVQGASNLSWRLSEVLSKLDHQLTHAYMEISDLARGKNLTLRDAALVVAVDRVATACADRGWI
jgi:glutamate dehydrogenase